MRNTLHILFTVVLAVMMCVTGFALTLDTAESAEEATLIPEESAALAATYAPGLNVITGTADVVTFDEDNAADYAATFTADNYDSKEIADIPDALDADGSLGNGLAFYHAKFDTVGSEIWHTIKQSWNSPDGKRKFFYTAKAAYYVGDGSAEQGAELTNTWSALQYMYDKSGGDAHHTVAAGKNVWSNWNIGAIPKSGYSLSYRHRVGTSASSTSNDSGACKYDLYTYIDNFGIYPYYMINYNVDGEITTEQVLLDADGNIMTSYIPSSENYPANSVDDNGNNIECIGWSTVEGAAEPMEIVALANEDVTLYPVWAQVGIIDSDVDWIAGAKDADTGVYAMAVVSATEGYTIDSWTVDVGNTKAEVLEDGSSVVITAAGYPGVVTVTAKSGDLTATKEIRIVGRDTGNFIIGVDIISGTDKGWTFDNTAEENALIGYFSRIGDTVSGFATEADGNTYVNLGWQLSGVDDSSQYYPQFVIYGYPKDTIGDRPLQFKADAMGTKNNFWLLNFGTLNISSGFKNSSAWTTSKYKITAVGTSATFNCQIGLNETQGAYKLDNISVTPYYKVTYYDFDSNEVATEWVLPEDGVLVPDLTKVEGATGYATELGGEAVPAIALANQDIELFAVKEDAISFVAGAEFVKVDLTDSAYTIPTAAELGMKVENFRLWTDGENNYFASDVVEDSSTLAGKTLTAVCFEEKLFDPAKGDLIYLFNFEGVTDKNTNTFLNMDYATGTASRWDGSSASVINDTDGNSVLKVVNNTTSAHSLFGYAVNYNEATIGSKITVQYDYKYMSSIDVYKNNGSASAFMRLTNTNADATADKYKNGSMSLGWASKVEDTWYKMSVSATDTAGEGWKGGIVQYQGLSTSAENTLYADNYAMYIYPAKTFVFLPEEGSDEYTKVVAEGDTYVMPASDAANAIAWTDGVNYYKFGETYNVSDIQFKAFYPFIQDASQPAVIFKYEGNIGVNGNEVVQTNGSSKYGEVIVDDGRDVLHLHAWNKSAQKDYRLILKSGDVAQYDVNEYKYFQFMYKTNNVQKVDDTVSTGYSADSSWNTCVYANYNGNGGFYTKVGETTILYQFNKNGITEATGNEYIIFEKDLSTISTTEGYPIGYGFTIDPVNTGTTRFGHDIYIDYVRVYRSGITTVTYDTNAPEGATIVTEVAPDTNRGVGTGYLLKGLRPVVEGYKFMGWALTPDAAAKDVIDSFDLTGDTTVYAVWATDETYVAPAETEEASIRGGAYNGIRFKATIMESQKANLDEFGFIATREALLPTAEGVADTSALTFNFKKDGAAAAENAPLYVTGVAYDKEAGIDIINGEESDGSTIYTAVATGIPTSAKKENMVMRTYAKYGFGDKYMVVYGGAMTNSLYDVAAAIKAENGEAYENNKDYITSILEEETAE